MYEYEPMDSYSKTASIKVIGVGGGGGNAVQHMINSGIDGVEFIVANTDVQDFQASADRRSLQLGENITKGLGAGADPEIGRQAALEDRDKIADVLQGADMVFIAAGMGGGTGTGAAPVIAQVSRELGILTVAIVTKPFRFELKKRMMVAESGIDELRKHVDSLIVIPNNKLVQAFKGLRIKEAFKAADDVLLGAVQGISDLITAPGQINVDFNDVKTVMSETGFAIMGSGEATGDNRAREAAEMAMSSPLLDDIDLHGARAVLVNITSNDSMTIDEFEEVGDTVAEFAAETATVIIGMSIDNELEDELRVTVVATGLGEPPVQLVHSSKEPVKATGKTLGGAPIKEQKMAVPVMRHQAGAQTVSSAQGPAGKKVANGGNMAYLDIPAFLRKQAD